MKYILALVFSFLCLFSYADAAKIDTSTICKVIAYDYNGYSKKLYAGTGFIYHKDENYYYIMTNGHTLQNARAGVAASFYKDDYMTSLVNCIVLKNDYQIGTSKDVAVLAIKKSDIPYEITPLKLMYEKVPPTKVVFGSGYPSGYWQQEWSGRVLQDNYERITVVNMPSVNGQSGSPAMVDVNGENYVVGMITYRFNNSVEPAQSSGGYIDMDYIYDVILDKTDKFDTVSEGRKIASVVTNDAYIITDKQGYIRVYYIVNGKKYPYVYTLDEVKRANLPQDLVFCPYDEHPIKKNYPILDRLPTINRPEKPWLPPFDKPTNPDSKPVSPKPSPDKFWPGGAPELTPKETPPKEAEKPSPENQDLNAEMKKLEEQYKKAMDAIKKAESEQKRLSHEALEAERAVWKKRQEESEKQRLELESKIAKLESDLSGLTAKEAKKPDVTETSSEKEGFLSKVFNGVTMIPSKVGSLFSRFGDNVTSDGVFWTIIATAGGMLIPGVRSALLARGVSPLFLKLGGWGLRFGGYLRRFKKKVNDFESEIITDEQKQRIQDAATKLTPLLKGESIKFPDVGTGPFKGVDSDGDPIPMQNSTIDVPWPKYENVHLTNSFTEESLKNIQNIDNSASEPTYNNTSEETPKEFQIGRNIKEVVEKQMAATGHLLQDLSYLGNLYEEGVRRLGANELKDVNGAPIQSCKTSADAVERWVKASFVNKITQQEARNPENSDYLYAYKGMLYKEAVKLLSTGFFTGVNNYKTAAEAVEKWVQDLLFEKLTRNI